MSDFLGAAGDLAGFALNGAGAWRARLRRAAFRGVHFYVEEMSGESGRRLANHEYPGRDTPWAEDLGRKQRRWTFTAYTIGATYTIERDALIRACDEEGPGSLIHPTIGAVQASCESIAFNERRDIGGYCAFSLVFVESGQRATPGSILDTIALVEAAAGALTDLISTAFGALFSITGSTGSSTVRGASSDVTRLCDTFDALRMPQFDVSQTDLVTQIASLRARAPTIVFNANDLAAACSGIFAAYIEASDPDIAMGGLSGIAAGFTVHTADWTPSVITTPSRALELSNGAAFQGMVRQLALREIGFTEPGLSLVSADQGEQMRSDIVEMFEMEETAVAAAGQDQLYQGLADLRAAILQDIDQRATQLPSLVPYATPISLNALTLAWRLYQDANRDLDVVERVHAINPSFMPITGRVLSE